MGWSLNDPNGPLPFSVWDFWRIWPMSMKFISKSQEEVASIRINMGWTSDTQMSLAAKSKEYAFKTCYWHMYIITTYGPIRNQNIIKGTAINNAIFKIAIWHASRKQRKIACTASSYTDPWPLTQRGQISHAQNAIFKIAFLNACVFNACC